MENTNNIIVMYEKYKISENDKNNKWSYVFNFTLMQKFYKILFNM